MSQQKNLALLSFTSLRLKELRALKGISQQDVLNDTKIHIARIETGKVNISISTLGSLCDYFEISLKEFFDSDIKM